MSNIVNFRRAQNVKQLTPDISKSAFTGNSGIQNKGFKYSKSNN